MSASYVPAGCQGVNVTLIYDDVVAAMAHYKAAFHATEVMHLTGDDGHILYAEMSISGTHVFLAPYDPDWPAKTPAMLGGYSNGLYVYVADVNVSHERALRAGMTQERAVETMSWGDTCSMVIDKFGYGWMLAQAGQV